MGEERVIAGRVVQRLKGEFDRFFTLEPITPEGSVYVTEHFAAGLALDPVGEFDCDYVGTIPAAKGYGDLGMYLLRARAPTRS